MDATQRVKNNFLESIQVKTESLDKLAPVIADAADRIANSLLNNSYLLLSTCFRRYLIRFSTLLISIL